MPGEAFKRGGACEVLPLEVIAQGLLRAAQGQASASAG
jgi:two-component system chemotaxis response regulator CheB